MSHYVSFETNMLYFFFFFFSFSVSTRCSLTPADFPVQYFHGRKEIVITTVTWFGGQNPFLPIAYLVSGGVIFILGVILTVVYVKLGRDGKNMEE